MPRPPSPATAPRTSCAIASGRPRPRANARSRRRPYAARPSSPPATPRCGWPASSRSPDAITTSCAARAPRSTNRPCVPGSSCTGCTDSRPTRSRSRCRSAGGCSEPGGDRLSHLRLALHARPAALRRTGPPARARPRLDRARARCRRARGSGVGAPTREAAMTRLRAERPAHRCTTRHAQAVYPFVAGGSLGGRGVFVGRDSSGGAFCYDPWVLYGDATLDDPNAIVLGKLGQGKSALVKTLLWRMLLFGRRAFVLVVKREYGPLCRAVGVEPISLVPGGGVRLNPLASRPEEHAQLELLRAVAVTALGGPVTQIEAGALREALRGGRDAGRGDGRGDPTLPEIAAVMFSPTGEMAARLRTSGEALAVDVRRCALALQD